jgi:hypothetical protein
MDDTRDRTVTERFFARPVLGVFPSVGHYFGASIHLALRYLNNSSAAQKLMIFRFE